MLDALGLATEAQQRATTPGHSAWVEANAGTGKTKVLTDRVTRLLLDGVKPERILCLTFTKAAAAEMRNRLASQLGRWALAEPDKLDEQIEALISRTPQPAERVVARRLFARVLDAPGGINILTIHAFCQALLKRFPLEAGVAPGFEVLDEAEAHTLLRHAQDEQMEALARPDAPQPLVDALAAVASKISIAEYAELMMKLLGERAWLLARIGDAGGTAARAGAPGRRDGLLGRRHGERLGGQRLPRSRLRCRGPARRGTSVGQGRQAGHSARRRDRRVAGGGRQPPGPAARLCQGLLYGQARDPGAARHQGRYHGDAGHRSRATHARPSGWPRYSTASTARRWSSAPWRCCSSASTSPAAIPAPSDGARRSTTTT